MKRLLLSAATLALIFTVGCKGTGGDPKSVLMSFVDALSKKDITTAKKYATKESETMLGLMEMGMKMAPEAQQKDDKFNKDNMEFGDANINGDMATVPVKDKKSGETTNFTLKKESGDWKVAFDKATMTQMGQDKMKEHGADMNKLTDTSTNRMNDAMDTSHSLMNSDTSH